MLAFCFNMRCNLCSARVMHVSHRKTMRWAQEMFTRSMYFPKELRHKSTANELHNA